MMTLSERVARLTDSAPRPVVAPVPLRKVCAWCLTRAELEAENRKSPPGTVTHGICPSCVARMEKQ